MYLTEYFILEAIILHCTIKGKMIKTFKSPFQYILIGHCVLLLLFGLLLAHRVCQMYLLYGLFLSLNELSDFLSILNSCIIMAVL